jgi:hypothetical protein
MKIYKIIVVLLLLQLFIGCKSDIFENIVGLYQGEAINKMRYEKGQVILDIKKYNKTTHEVDASIKWSDGLFGEGNLFGKTETERLILKGSISVPWGLDDLELDCKCDQSSNKIWCKYKVTPIPEKSKHTKIQEGEFTVTKLSTFNQ